MLRAQRRLEFARVVGRETETPEESGLESPDGMRLREQIALEFRPLDDGLVEECFNAN
jgi:hypothetical protein